MEWVSKRKIKREGKTAATSWYHGTNTFPAIEVQALHCSPSVCPTAIPSAQSMLQGGTGGRVHKSETWWMNIYILELNTSRIPKLKFSEKGWFSKEVSDKVPRNCYFYVPNSRLHSSKSSVSWHLILGDLTFFALKFPGHPPADRNHDSMNQNSRTLSYLILPITHSTETSAYVSWWDHLLLKGWSTMWDHVGSTFPFQHGYKVGQPWGAVLALPGRIWIPHPHCPGLWGTPEELSQYTLLELLLFNAQWTEERGQRSTSPLWEIFLTQANPDFLLLWLCCQAQRAGQQLRSPKAPLPSPGKGHILPLCCPASHMDWLRAIHTGWQAPGAVGLLRLGNDKNSSWISLQCLGRKCSLLSSSWVSQAQLPVFHCPGGR